MGGGTLPPWGPESIQPESIQEVRRRSNPKIALRENADLPQASAAIEIIRRSRGLTQALEGFCNAPRPRAYIRLNGSSGLAVDAAYLRHALSDTDSRKLKKLLSTSSDRELCETMTRFTFGDPNAAKALDADAVKREEVKAELTRNLISSGLLTASAIGLMFSSDRNLQIPAGIQLIDVAVRLFKASGIYDVAQESEMKNSLKLVIQQIANSAKAPGL